MKPYLVHMTDIFHPHGDPDDHYDLAVAFALHVKGYLELAHVFMDYPPAHRVGDPALCAVAQLNRITNSCVPASVAPKDTSDAMRQILCFLRQAPRPVTFSVVGTTANIAAAIDAEPELFKQKCAAIYLAAGTGVEREDGALEYNVRLNPQAYIKTLSAPCPVFWAPCYHTITATAPCEQGGEFSSVYCFRQRELIEKLSPSMQNYFLYMLTRSNNPKYLRYLDNPVDSEALSGCGNVLRRLWSTPLLLHIGGVPLTSAEFLPVSLSCSREGRVQWTPARTGETNKYIMHIIGCDRNSVDSFDTSGSYKAEMVATLCSLLGDL